MVETVYLQLSERAFGPSHTLILLSQRSPVTAFDRIPVPRTSAVGTCSDRQTELMKYDPEKLLFAGDLAGTLLFAIEGATAAISGNLDVLGLMVLAFATALGGGIIRDLLIGAVPPNSLRDWRYSAVVFTGRGHRFLPASFRSRYSQWSHDCSRRSGIGAVRRRWDAKGVDLQNASLHCDSGDNHWSGWRDDSPTCSWREYLQSCAPMSMPPRPWQDQLR